MVKLKVKPTHGITWHHMAIHGNTWHQMASHGNTWQHMELHGITWEHMESHGCTSQHNYGTTWQHLATPAKYTILNSTTHGYSRKIHLPDTTPHSIQHKYHNEDKKLKFSCNALVSLFNMCSLFCVTTISISFVGFWQY